MNPKDASRSSEYLEMARRTDGEETVKQCTQAVRHAPAGSRQLFDALFLRAQLLMQLNDTQAASADLTLLHGSNFNEVGKKSRKRVRQLLNEVNAKLEAQKSSTEAARSIPAQLVYEPDKQLPEISSAIEMQHSGDKVQCNSEGASEEPKHPCLMFYEVALDLLARTPITDLVKYVGTDLSLQCGGGSRTSLHDLAAHKPLDAVMSFVGAQTYLADTDWPGHMKHEERLMFVESMANALMHRLRQNCYMIQSAEFISCDQILAGESTGTAVYVLSSMYNHSCLPNVFCGFHGNVAEWRTTRDIQAGEELCPSYGPRFGSALTENRQYDLEMRYSFTCDCVACTQPTYRRVECALFSHICQFCECPATYAATNPEGIFCCRCKKDQPFSKRSLMDDISRCLESTDNCTDGDQVDQALSTLFTRINRLNDKILQLKVAVACRICKRLPQKAASLVEEVLVPVRKYYSFDPAHSTFFLVAALRAHCLMHGCDCEQAQQLIEEFVRIWVTASGIWAAKKRFLKLELFPESVFHKICDSLDTKTTNRCDA